MRGKVIGLGSLFTEEFEGPVYDFGEWLNERSRMGHELIDWGIVKNWVVMGENISHYKIICIFNGGMPRKQ